MPDQLMHEDERMDQLNPSGFRILQKIKGFHFTMDAVLLADFARIREKDVVADFGTGTGILPLLCISRGKGASFHAFEIQPEMAEMASRSMAMNQLSERVKIHASPVEHALDILPPLSCDAVISNPPYGSFGTTLLNPEANQRISRHQGIGGLDEWIRTAFLLLKGKGRFSMIYPAPQMLEAMDALRRGHLTPKRFRLIYPFADRPANLVMIDAVKDGRPMLQPEPPLIIRNPDGTETDELKRIYRMEDPA